MKRRNILGAATAALALIGALAAPAHADTQGTSIADIRGTVKSVALPSLVVTVQSVSGDHLRTTLRLFTGHDLTLTTDSATVARLDNKVATLAVVRAGDPITLRARCTFTTTNNVTTTSCLALTTYSTTPKPVTFSVKGTVNAKAATSFTMMATKFEYDSRGKGVANALKAAQPFTVGVDTKTVVRLGDVSSTYAALAAGNLVQVHLTCQPQAPYNCMATRIDITAPRTVPVIMVGTVTALTTVSLTVNVGSVVPRDDDTLDVQALHNQTLLLAVARDTSVRRGTTHVALASIAVGTQVTVRARCQLVTPLTCFAERITAKA